MSLLTVFLFAESGVRGIAETLPEPIEWYDANAQVKIEQMDRYQEAGRRADFVFAGTSMVFRGIAPLAFDAASDSATFSYNAGLLAGMPPIMQRWILEEVEPRLKPRVVVYGLSSIDFQERRYKFPIRAYESAPATQRGFMASAQRLGGRLLEIVRLRTTLRDPEAWTAKGEAGQSEGPVERTRQRMDPRGHIFKARENRDRAERIRIRDNVLRDFEISQRGTRNLARIVRTLERRGVSVVLVSMPVPEGYVQAHPAGRADFDDAKHHSERIADRLGVPFVDMSRSMPEGSFVDFTHLGERGAERFSRELRGELQRLGF